jgi:hypothetical protein
VIRIAHSVYITALGLWVGGLATLGTIVAPVVFQKAPTRGDAGRIFGPLIERFGWVEVGLSAGVLVASWILRKSPGPRWGRIRLVWASVLTLLVAISVFGVTPAVTQASARLGDIDRLPPEDPGRVSFLQLHRASETLASATLLGGFALLAVSAAGPKPRPDGA